MPTANGCVFRLMPLLVGLALVSRAAGAHPGPHLRIAELTRQIERSPGVARLWLERAAEYLADGDATTALRDLDRARALDRRSADVPLLRGEALLALGRAAEAEAELTVALERAPTIDAAHRLRGRARRALGRSAEAAPDFERCVALASSPTPDDYLEWSRALVAAGRADAAIAALERGLAAVRGCAALVQEAVTLDCARGDFDAALARIERNPAAFGSAVALGARRGEVLRAAGRELDAEAEFTAALAALEASPGRRQPALEARLRAALVRPATGAGAR